MDDLKKFIRITIGDILVGAYMIMFAYYFMLVRQNPIPKEGWVGTVIIVVMWLLTRNDKNIELTIGKVKLDITDKPIYQVLQDRRVKRNDEAN